MKKHAFENHYCWINLNYIHLSVILSLYCSIISISTAYIKFTISSLFNPKKQRPIALSFRCLLLRSNHEVHKKLPGLVTYGPNWDGKTSRRCLVSGWKWMMAQWQSWHGTLIGRLEDPTNIWLMLSDVRLDTWYSAKDFLKLFHSYSVKKKRDAMISCAHVCHLYLYWQFQTGKERSETQISATASRLSHHISMLLSHKGCLESPKSSPKISHRLLSTWGTSYWLKEKDRKMPRIRQCQHQTSFHTHKKHTDTFQHLGELQQKSHQSEIGDFLVEDSAQRPFWLSDVCMKFKQSHPTLDLHKTQLLLWCL